ncbi:hypothetical protein KAI87_06445 [Myxococcota bacterium]|nr:hypothetical protein [Myxococcota bacterium]
MLKKTVFMIMMLAGLTIGFAACGGDDADSLGIGAECAVNNDCNQDIDPPLVCLDAFSGGYCGLSGCTADVGCPENSICVTYDDEINYCFRACTDKDECNVNRSEDNEANCSSSVDRVGDTNLKVCLPPSSGI